ncbi:putative transport protein [Cryptosporidium felis]|nr:putative transport protein [Cryptosporidium felis]
MKIVDSNENGSQIVARWMLLACISLVTMGIMYSSDTLPAIAPFIFDAFEDLYSKEEFEYYYNTLCSLVSVPNLIFPLLAGVLIDTVSLYYLSMVLISFLVLGQLVLTVGFGAKSLALMLAGRCIFGLGSESSLIAFNSLLIKYFPDWEVALALSICLAIGRIGSVLSDMVSPIIATLFPVYWTLLLGLVLLVVGGASVVANLRRYYLEDLTSGKTDTIFTEARSASHSNLVSHREVGSAQTSHLGNLKFRVVLIGRKIRGLGRLYWYLSLLGLLSYSVIMPFNYIAGPLIVETQYKDIPPSTARQYAGIIMSLLYAVSVLVLPVLGWIVDRVGERCKLLTISVGLLALAHALMLKLHPAISITILGFGYTLFATVYWPCISISVPPTLLGTALGVVTCIQNLGFIVTPIQVAFLHSTFRSYVAVESFFLLICVLALVVCLVVSRVDVELGGRLDSAPNGASAPSADLVLTDLESLLQAQNKAAKINLEELISRGYFAHEGARGPPDSRKFVSSSSVSTFDDSEDSLSDSSLRKSSVFLKKQTLPLADYSVQSLDDRAALSARTFQLHGGAPPRDDPRPNNQNDLNKYYLNGIII